MSLLDKANEPPKISAPKIVIYGAEKMGKSTFASQAPAPIFMDIEDGVGYIKGVKTVPILDYQMLMDVLEELLTTDHKFKSIPIDSISWLSDIIIEHIKGVHDVEDIRDAPWGVGWSDIKKYTVMLLNKLDQLRKKKGMCPIFIGHSVIKTITPPDAEPYDIFQIEGEKGVIEKINKWADCILYAKMNTMVVDDKTFDTGRVLLANKSAAHASGSRMALPDEMPFEEGEAWKTFYNNYKDAIK